MNFWPEQRFAHPRYLALELKVLQALSRHNSLHLGNASGLGILASHT
jgi:hypothetical protein